MTDPLLQTTVVGSYPQPDWLVNRPLLSARACRARACASIWRVPEPFLEQAQDDATLLAIRDMERAGIDIITDGEMRRESYSNRFATALEGIDDEHPAEIVNNRGQKTPVPRVVGKIRRTQARRAARHAVPARQHRQARQDHPARALHHGPAGQGRVLQGRRGDVHGLRRGGERGGARAGQGRRRRDPARRAVAAQQSRGGQALRREGHQPCAAGHHGADGGASLLRLRRRGDRAASRRATPSCRSSPTPSPSRSRSNRRSPSSISAC